MSGKRDVLIALGQTPHHRHWAEFELNVKLNQQATSKVHTPV